MKTLYSLAAICFAIAFTNLHAQTHNWTGNGGDSNWFNANNWDTGTVPIETSTVSIVGNVMVEITTDSAEAFAIDLHNNAILMLANDLETESIITVHPTATFHFASGTLSGSGVQNFGLLKLEGPSARTFSNTSVTNHAEFLVTESNQTNVLSTTINNMSTGILDISSVGGFLQHSTSSVINNDGLLRKSPDAMNPFGTFYLILEINNHGTIEVKEDQTFLLLAASSTFTNFEDGLFTGNGIYDITTTFINEGTVLPGGSEVVGSLDITNSFTLNGGSIQIDMAGTQTGEFDSIDIVGSPIMEGSFDINLLFAPQLGDEFQVVSWNLSGSSCDFPQFTSTVFDGFEYTFETICNSNDVTLKLVDISVLGVSDLSKDSVQFFIHPNPLSNEGTFVFSSEWITSEETTLTIFNAMGQQVLSVDGFTSESNTFHRGNLPGGVYFAQVLSEGEVIATTKIILD